MRTWALILSVVAGACNITGPDADEPAWIVRGVVTAGGQRIAGARITASSLPSLLGPGPSAATQSASDGSFELQMPGCAHYALTATHRLYELLDVRGFRNDACPSTLFGVAVLMERYPPLTIATTVLPSAAITIPYEESLSATGGAADWQWSLVSGTLPADLSLHPSGSITGTPTEAGTWQFVARVETSDDQSAEGEVSITVAGGPIVAPRESCSAYPDSAVVTFEDAQLQRLVRHALGVGNRDLLTCGLVAELSTLDASAEAASALTPPFGTSVTSIAGIQNLVGLTSLDLSGSRDLSDISSLEGLTRLRRLNLASCGVDDVTALAALTSLVFLDLSNNARFDPYRPLTDISPLASLTSLTELRIRDDRVSDLQSLSGMTSLETLDAYNNLIVDIGPLAALTGLTRLDLHYNQVEDLTVLSGMAGLEYLDLSSNSVDDLGPLAGSSRLLHLDLSWAGTITHVGPLSGLASLRYLDLSGGRFTDTTPLGGLQRLEALLLEQGRIQTLALDDLPSLVRLDAEDNEITAVSLSALPSLTDLTLGSNSITDLGGLQDLTGLVSLDLSLNRVTELAPLATLTTLGYLWLSGNTALSSVQPLLDNPGIGSGDMVALRSTAVSCADVARLAARGVTVLSDCS